MTIDWSGAEGLNSAGQIVGYFTLPGNGTFRAFLYQSGTVAQLPALPGPAWTNAIAYAINEDGLIIGESDNKAVRWLNGVIEPLNLPVGPSSSPYDLNEKGQIVGWMGVQPNVPWSAEAFLWQDGQTTTFDLGPGVTHTIAHGINNHGQVCLSGLVQVKVPGGTQLTRRAYLWQDGSFIELQLPPGFVGAWPRGINDLGEIVGQLITPGSPAGVSNHRFVWKNGVMRQIEEVMMPLPGITLRDVGSRRPINNAGQIVVGASVAGASGGVVPVILTPVPPRVGDVNCDWIVNHLDLIQIIQNWGPGPAPPAPPLTYFFAPDINGDGVVNVNDLLLVINNWTFGGQR